MSDPEIKADLTVNALMYAITDLVEMANDGIGYNHIQANIDDLELSHARLGQLLNALHATKKAAQ